jgi:EAL domain-containing protein (putative c-di-GMP-specific phosphodiesterase class I)
VFGGAAKGCAGNLQRPKIVCGFSSPVDQVFVRAMVELAHGLGKQTIAEFVEDEETLQLLGQLGVDYAQGYDIGRPAPLPAQLDTLTTS